MKRVVVLSLTAVILISLVAALMIISPPQQSNGNEFYVGVTYCGESIADAQRLVDKVKNYTNLFVVQSGPLMADGLAIEEIGDYAVTKGLHFAVFFDTSQVPEKAIWLQHATTRWGNMFSGVYYADEPGGKLLDTQLTFLDTTGDVINKMPDGTIQTLKPYFLMFFPNGTIGAQKSNNTYTDIEYADPVNFSLRSEIIYSPDGTTTIFDQIDEHIQSPEYSSKRISETFYTPQNGSERIVEEETYLQVQKYNPVPNVDVAADLFISKTSKPLNDFIDYWNLSQRSYPMFTADYGLYWWDYKAGYDTILAELGWNNSINQEIGLVRGAASAMHKDWGTILTWKYMQPPYLCSGDEMYHQLKTSYQTGAKYTLIFNYAQNMSTPYGILQDQHFEALERFWNDVVENPQEVQGSIRAETAFVLPKNFGWGLRNPQDKIFGIWQPTEQDNQTWTNLQAALTKHDLKLDIIYDDPTHPITGRYQQTIHGNQR